MTGFQKAVAFKAASVLAVLSACATLAGCGQYGLKGDRGLPPPPDNVAYPNLGSTPSEAGRPLKSKAEQQRIQAELLAGKRARR